MRPEIERQFRVPAISVCGSEHWLGEWTFLLNNGSMTDEPILWAHLMGKAGQTTAGVLVERSYIGPEYLKNFRRAAQFEGIQIVAEEAIAQTGQDISAAVAALHEAGASAIVHCGFGLGVAEINAALEALGWDPPRYMGTAFETGFNEHLWDAYRGWIGLEQYDEANQVGQQFLAEYEAAYGHRPEYYGPLLWRDCAMALLYAFADAAPLSPLGREGVTGAGQDAAGGVRLARHAHLVRPVAPPRLGGRGLPRRPVARRRRQGARRVLEVVSRRTLRPGLNRLGGQMLR